jgi:hypothetical protein
VDQKQHTSEIYLDGEDLKTSERERERGREKADKDGNKFNGGSDCWREIYKHG